MSNYMQENYLVQKNHYDSQAIIEPADRLPWEFDENSSQYCLQGPYLFCRDWFTGKAHGKNILDFGCGARALSIFVFPPHGGATITGIDISPISVESAQNKAKHFDCSDQISFEVGNCEALPFEDDSFDYIFSAGTLSCLNLHKAFSEISRVLKPEGSAVLVDTL